MKCELTSARLHLGAVMAVAALAACTVLPFGGQAADYPSEIMLGAFWENDNNTTDTLYWSEDGYNFYELCEAYKDATPDGPDVWIDAPDITWNTGTIHDPSIMYRDGYFWMVTAHQYVDESDGQRRFAPMIGYSKDLVHWSYANSGSSTNVRPTTNPIGKNGQEITNGMWDVAGPEFFLDDDGSVWILVSFGYWAWWNNDADPTNCYMQPYLVKVNELRVQPGADPSVDRKTPPIASYSDAVPVNLPTPARERDDGAIFKEDGWYYMIIKQNGVTQELWRTKSLETCSDPNSWELICDDVVTDYEGPCITKYRGEYYLFTDKLRGSLVTGQPDTEETKDGVFVCKATIGTTGKLDEYTGWLEDNLHRIQPHAANGSLKEARHGTVITVTDPAAIKTICDLRATTRYANPKDPGIQWKDTGWYKKEKYRIDANGGICVNFWYENGVRQGIKLKADGTLDTSYRGKEIYDPDTDAWYWLDSIYKGQMACGKYEVGGKEVWLPKDKDRYNADPVAYGENEKDWKWVRYDWDGKMIKGEYLNPVNQGWYRYDEITGAMTKGFYTYRNGDGYWVTTYYDLYTGTRVVGAEFDLNGRHYCSDAYGTVTQGQPIPPMDGWYIENGQRYWYENGVRQGYDPNNAAYRGKEIFDPMTNAWYWLDNIQQGAVAKSKDVYQESSGGKWVRYDSDGLMIKGWSPADTKEYYFDPITGAMAKGDVVIDGVPYHFDEATGRRQA